MRNVDDVPLRAWAPPDYRVDERGKVVGARPGPRHNWGRWGEEDQRGTANLLTPEQVATAAALVRTGRAVSLGLPIGGAEPGPGTRTTPMHLFSRTTADRLLGDAEPHGLQTSDDILITPLQATTQVDGLGHVAADDVLFNGFWAGLVTARSGARRLGLHHLAGGLVGRGVLLDVAAVADVDPFGGQIGPELLELAERSHGVRVGAGDVLLVRTGFLDAWYRDAASRRRRRQAGLTLSTIEWLADRDVAVVAADNRTVEVVPGDPGEPVLAFHTAAVRDLGLVLGELFDLEDLACACQDEGRYEFLFVGTPLPLINSVGSPVNPVAIF